MTPGQRHRNCYRKVLRRLYSSDVVHIPFTVAMSMRGSRFTNLTTGVAFLFRVWGR